MVRLGDGHLLDWWKFYYSESKLLFVWVLNYESEGIEKKTHEQDLLR